MKTPTYKVKIGIVGCGAIGQGIALQIQKDLSKDAKVVRIFDIDKSKSSKLSKKLKIEHVVSPSIDDLINKCDCMIEAVNSENTVEIIKKAVKAHKSVLAMSVGKLLNADKLFQLARKNKCYIMLPSGAIAGIDAIKAASLVGIKKITLTTKKPLKGFANNEYFAEQGFDVSKIKKETVIFDGTVQQAVKRFPQNINVAATLALASQMYKKMRIRIITSPNFTKNVHEIEMVGDFGRLVTKTENVVCPENPKTSYLAILSGFQTLKQFCTGFLVGT